jgi:hypothetical protein
MEPIEVVKLYKGVDVFNLAGIIPIAGYANEYGTIWPDYLNPLNQGYYPFHKSVMECAFAGCDSIWIVCNHDYMPTIKKFIGEAVIDPITYDRIFINKSGRKYYKRKTIPIMYIAMDNKYLLNTTIPFSALYGAYMVKKTSNKISKWIKPDRYFISFMNQQYNVNKLFDIRNEIRNKKPFFVSHNGKTVLDDCPSAFTIDNDDLFNILKWSKIKNNSSLQQVFGKIKTEDSYIWEPEYCFDTKTWEGLREYMGSPLTERHKVIHSIFTSFKFKKLYKEPKNGNV